jgi:hypothetical protein
MAIAEHVSRARANGSAAGQYVPPGKRPANVDEVVDLLENASESRTAHAGVRRAANALLEAMSLGRWRVTAGRHRGGVGGGGRGADQNDHITVAVRGRGYHLQLTIDGHLRRITGDDGVELIPPWLPPGAPVLPE